MKYIVMGIPSEFESYRPLRVFDTLGEARTFCFDNAQEEPEVRFSQEGDGPPYSIIHLYFQDYILEVNDEGVVSERAVESFDRYNTSFSLDIPKDTD